MTDALIVAQTLFYFVVSFAIIAVGVLLSVAAYHFAKLAKHLRRISENVEGTTEEVRRNISEIIEDLRDMPFLSFLFRKGRRAGNRNSWSKKEKAE